MQGRREGVEGIISLHAHTFICPLLSISIGGFVIVRPTSVNCKALRESGGGFNKDRDTKGGRKRSGRALCKIYLGISSVSIVKK